TACGWATSSDFGQPALQGLGGTPPRPKSLVLPSVSQLERSTMQEQAHDREWASHWPLVLTSLLGVSLATIGTYSAGLFLGPLEAEFGWTRTQVTSGLLIYALIAVPLSPFVGVAIDRWGARRLAIPGSVATGLAFAAFAFTNGSQWLWW